LEFDPLGQAIYFLLDPFVQAQVLFSEYLRHLIRDSGEREAKRKIESYAKASRLRILTKLS
jgi:hypothetical protein